MGSVCHGILLYVKLLWCSGVTYIYCRLEEGWGQSSMGICAFLLYKKLILCSGFPEIYAQLEEAVGQSVMLTKVYVHSTIY